jgi:hypothetical protein
MYRAAIEVLKWTEAKTVLQVAQVSQLWQRITSSEELWHSLLEEDGLKIEDLEQVPPTAQACYRALIITRYLVLFRDEHLYLYDCKDRTFEHSYPVTSVFTESCAVALLRPQTVFACSLKGATQMRLSQGTFETLSSMIFPRQYHSIVACNASIYAFGGEHLSSAEQYHFSSKSWSQLPWMNKIRSHFNACREGKLIYLCEGSPHSCETFNVDSRLYVALPFYTPYTYTPSQMPHSITFFYKAQLMCVSGEKVYIMRDTRVEVKSKRMALVSWANQAPVVIGNRVYVVMFANRNILEIRLDNLASRGVCSN